MKQQQILIHTTKLIFLLYGQACCSAYYSKANHCKHMIYIYIYIYKILQIYYKKKTGQQY